MTEKRKVSALIVLALIVLPSIAHALSLSTLQKKNLKEVRQGETAEFTVLFWNLEDSPTPMSFKVRETLDDWVVIIKPEEFLLNKSNIGPPYGGDEYLGLPGVGDVEVFPVKVLVNVPEDAEPGKYETSVTVTAGSPGSGVSILQTRTFKFTTDVKRLPTFFETVGKTITDSLNTILASGNDAVNKITGMFASPGSNTLSFTLSIIAILMVLWAVYKRV